MNIPQRLDDLIEQHGAKHWTFAARKDTAFVDAVMEATQHLADLSFTERVFCAANDFDPRCANGSRKKLISMTKGWAFCGPVGKCPCAKETISKKSRENIDHVARLAKTRATLVERYGTENPADLPQAREAHRKFYEDRSRVDEALAKGRATMLERYGVENAFHLVENQRGREISQRHLTEETRLILADRTRFEEATKGLSSTSAATLLGIDVTTVNNYFRSYGIERELSSSYEDEIATFLREQGIDFLPRDRTVIRPRELDFYLQEHNLAIEFNGLYWHSDQVVERLYHRDKWKACHEAGVRLLMINEDEWARRPEVLKKKILNLCGKSVRGCGARKLTIRAIDNKTALDFIDIHHIQGSPSSCSMAYGAFHDDDLVAVLTLFRQRGTGHLDLTRFCTDGRIFAGAFSKMLKAASRDISEPIVTFADLRYSDGGVYEKNGFVNEGVIAPDYRYVKRNETFHKSLFTKDRIAKKFGLDMTNKTEREAMQELGYYRIYDCGKIRYRYSR